ncbi:unnamed protein product [Polarella glacialis]|uniref:Uncharacterized protein n=1 Tax=Polarella glacialis TaxID=89957 RepID=A0A813JSQ9_POLGL|nr:unnamed protein product [Polarella glacialis]
MLQRNRAWQATATTTTSSNNTNKNSNNNSNNNNDDSSSSKNKNKNNKHKNNNNNNSLCVEPQFSMSCLLLAVSSWFNCQHQQLPFVGLSVCVVCKLH